MAMESNESMVRYLVLEVIEAAVNLALSYEPAALEQLRQHSGKAIKIKTLSPDWMFVVAFCDDGVQLFAEYEETVDARITLPTALLAQYILGTSEADLQGTRDVRASGDLVMLAEVLQVLQAFSIWIACKRILNNWLPEFAGISGLLEALKHHDPAWIVRLEHLPQLANETLQAVRRQGELLQQQANEIRAIRRQLDADRRASQVSTVIGFCLLLVAFLTHNGYLQVAVLETLSMDTMLLLVLSMVLLVPRLLGRR